MTGSTDNDAPRSSLWCQWVNTCAGLTPDSRRNFRTFSRWQATWAVSLAVIAFAHEFANRLEFATTPGVITSLTAIQFVLACLTLRAYARFVRSADELTQKIQAESLKASVAVVVLYVSLHPLAEQLGAGATQFPTLLFLLLAGHAVGQTLAARRYR
jgi:hypothetical protein